MDKEVRRKNRPQMVQKIRVIGVVTALFFGLMVAGPAYSADSYPPQGQAAQGSAQPVVTGYRVQDIRDWHENADPYAPNLRASVPLQKRNAPNSATQVKPELDGKAEIMLMQGDYGNSFFGSTTYNNTFSDLTLNFWQYADYWSPWHGAASQGVPQAIYNPASSNWRDRGFEFGIMTLPSPEYTNAAHRNGVKSVAILYFDPAFRPGLTFNEMFEKDPKSKGYVVAKKLVDMAKFYGFDGYFLNEEEGGSRREEFKPFMAYLTKAGLYTQWYDVNSQFNQAKAQWLRDKENGQIHNSVFVNYGNDGRAMNQWALANGYDPYKEVFAGIEANQTRFKSQGGVERGFRSASNHSPLTSVVLFTPSDFYQRGLDDDIKTLTKREDTKQPFMQRAAYQWMIAKRERMYFSGMRSDVTKTGSQNAKEDPSVGVKDKGWGGVADFAPARSVIRGTNFATDFSTGKGMRSYTDGKVSAQSEWSDIGAQAILPSWQWWVSGADGADSTIEADFDYGEEPRNDINGRAQKLPFLPQGAWSGGNSLVLSGTAKTEQTVRLYKTDLSVVKGTTATVVWKKTGTAKGALKLGLIFADDPKTVVTLPLENSGKGWGASKVELGKYSGRQIATIALVVSEAEQPVQFNVGQFSLSDGSSVPVVPAGLKIDELLDDGQLNVSWKKADFSQVDYYILEAIDSTGKLHHLGKTYGDRRYVKQLPVAGNFTLQLRAIGKNAVSSKPARLVVNRSSQVHGLSYQLGQDVNKYFTQAAEPGKVTLNWKLTSGSEARGYLVKLETLGSGAGGVFTGYASVKVGPKQTSLTLPAPPEGLPFRATVSALGVAETAVPGVSIRGRYHDYLAQGMEKRDFEATGVQAYHLNNPTVLDWQKITSAGGAQWVATRGKNSSWGNNDENGRLTGGRTLKTPVTYTITDYAGNTSQPLILASKDGKISVDDKVKPILWASPWGQQAVGPGQKLVPIKAAARDNFSAVKVSATLSTQSQGGNGSALKDMGAGSSSNAHVPVGGVLSLGDGLSFDPKTLTVSGTPTWSGKRFLRFSATDEAGNISTMEVVLTAGAGTDGPTPKPGEPTAPAVPTLNPIPTAGPVPAPLPGGEISEDKVGNSILASTGSAPISAVVLAALAAAALGTLLVRGPKVRLRR